MFELLFGETEGKILWESFRIAAYCLVQRACRRLKNKAFRHIGCATKHLVTALYALEIADTVLSIAQHPHALMRWSVRSAAVVHCAAAAEGGTRPFALVPGSCATLTAPSREVSAAAVAQKSPSAAAQAGAARSMRFGCPFAVRQVSKHTPLLAPPART